MAKDSSKQDNTTSKIREFLQMVAEILQIGYLPADSGFTVEGPDFMFENYEEMSKEAPITAELIETGDFEDDMDGWRVWIHINDVGQYDQPKYIQALRRDFDEALRTYQTETNTTWRPHTAYIHCPVCGSPVELFAVCQKCQWENTGETNIDGGPNKMTLVAAIDAYQKGLPIE